MKAWISRSALLAVVAVSLAACGGGGDNTTLSATATGAPVEMPALVTQVEPYQRADASAPLKRQLPLARGSRPQPAMVRLARLDAAQSAAGGSAGPGRPVQIGSARDVPPTSQAQRMRDLLQFKPGAAGEGPTAAVSFTSPGAAGIRLGLVIGELPAAARVRGYTHGGDTVFEVQGRDLLAITQRNRDAGDVGERGRTWWTPVIESEEATLEITLPPGASPEAVKVSVPLLSHVSVKAQELETLVAASAGSCEIDVSCATDTEPQSRATARMIFVEGGYSYACTGTLLNDAQSSGTPYFLSANHCISSQTAASSLVTYWFYRSASCNSWVLSPDVRQLTGGATLLYSSTLTDTAFMRLNSQPPAAATFAGWSAVPPQSGQELIGVHHPRGDLQKISRGAMTGFISCSVGATDLFSCRPGTAGSGRYLSAQWSQGTVESGSSGSGLFASIAGGRYLVGQLKGGSASCQEPSGLNAYGRFDIAYSAALARWLSPSQPVTATPPSAAPVVARIPVHRFYNFATRAHFYTPIPAERDYVIANFPSYAYEGVAFYAYETQVAGSMPVFRLYNRLNRRHFYTISTQERAGVLANYPEMTDEGVGWYAQAGSGGTSSPVYRFYNATVGSHFFTISEVDRAIVLKDHPTYAAEGVAYYAWTTQ